MSTVSVVIPAFNEQATILSVVREVLKVPHITQLVIVDDCSTDDTARLAQSAAIQDQRITFTRHSVNQGKTAALRTGFALTTGDIVLVQDADLEYDPVDIPELIQPILDNKPDVVFGSRFLVRRRARVLYFYHYVANRGLTLLSNVFTNVNMTDVETGYKAFRGEIIRNMKINSSGFGFEIEVAAKVAKLGCAIYEVPISYNGRTYEEGKKIGVSDGVAALFYILYYNLFVSLSRSYREIPRLRSHPDEAHRVSHV